MGKLCNTAKDETWRSEIKSGSSKVKDGDFRIDSEDGEGFFVGVFVEQGGPQAGKEIRGRCDGNSIYFFRSIDKPRFYYEGSFSSDKKKLNGTRTSLPIKKGVQDSEEWQGTKVSTFEGDI